MNTFVFTLKQPELPDSASLHFPPPSISGQNRPAPLYLAEPQAALQGQKSYVLRGVVAAEVNIFLAWIWTAEIGDKT